MSATENSEWIIMSSLNKSDKLIAAIVVIAVGVCSIPLGVGFIFLSLEALSKEINFQTVLAAILSGLFSAAFVVPVLGGLLALWFPDVIQVDRINQKLLIKSLGCIVQRHDLSRADRVTVDEKYDSMDGSRWRLLIHFGGRQKLVYSSSARGAREAIHLVADRIRQCSGI